MLVGEAFPQQSLAPKNGISRMKVKLRDISKDLSTRDVLDNGRS